MALVERYAAGDVAFLEEYLARAEDASDDPAVQVVTFIRLFEDAADQMVAEQPSCLYVSYVFEQQLYEDGTVDVIVDTVLTWRTRLADKLRAAAKVHPPADEVDPDVLADHVFATFEGLPAHPRDARPRSDASPTRDRSSLRGTALRGPGRMRHSSILTANHRDCRRSDRSRSGMR